MLQLIVNHPLNTVSEIIMPSLTYPTAFLFRLFAIHVYDALRTVCNVQCIAERSVKKQDAKIRYKRLQTTVPQSRLICDIVVVLISHSVCAISRYA